MSSVRLYLDEDTMRRSLVFGLRARNVDVLTASEASMINRADHEHLSMASSLGRVLYTHNVGDFCVLHEEWLRREETHSGTIVAGSNAIRLGKSFAD